MAARRGKGPGIYSIDEVKTSFASAISANKINVYYVFCVVYDSKNCAHITKVTKHHYGNSVTNLDI